MGHSVVFLLLCCHLSWMTSVRSDLFSALVDLERVLYAEREVAHDLRTYINMEQQRLETLMRLAEEFEAHSTEALVDPERHLANPVRAFQLVKRFTTDWTRILERYIYNNATAEFLVSLQPKLSKFPSDEDLHGAATALLRLQDTYGLRADRVARGHIEGVESSAVMSANDCFELGRIAYMKEDFYHTVLWMTEALHVLDLEEPSPSTDRATVLDYLAYAMYKQGNTRQALKLTNDLLQLAPGVERILNNKNYYEQLLNTENGSEEGEGEGEGVCEGEEGGEEGCERKVREKEEVKNEQNVEGYHASEEYITYQRLCRGEKTHVYKALHSLTCQYVRYHPLFYIRPLREEVMYHKPRIVIIHDALTDKEMDHIKDLATPRLARATVVNPQTGVLETAAYRVSKSAWLKDVEDPTIARISRKIMAMTNLTLETAEELQVVNYGIGGQYDPHFDFAPKRDPPTHDPTQNNRIFTFICYMSDVEAGGATVFPKLGVRLMPRKGSCALWYNLLRSGEGDWDTLHAACPVLVGSKWVCNKWFHEVGQEFTRPCSLDPLE